MINIRLNDVMEYTEWERQKWHHWLQEHAITSWKSVRVRMAMGAFKASAI